MQKGKLKSKVTKRIVNIYNHQLRHVSWVECAWYVADLNTILQTGGSYMPDIDNLYDVEMFGEDGQQLISMLRNMKNVPADVFTNPKVYSAEFQVTTELANGEFEYTQTSFKLKNTTLRFCEDTDTIQVAGGAAHFEDLARPAVDSCARVEVHIKRLQ